MKGNPATMTAAEVAEALGVSEWSLYRSVREGTCPIEPIRVGRRMVWSSAKVMVLLGMDPVAVDGASAQWQTIESGASTVRRSHFEGERS